MQAFGHYTYCDEEGPTWIYVILCGGLDAPLCRSIPRTTPSRVTLDQDLVFVILYGCFLPIVCMRVTNCSTVVVHRKKITILDIEITRGANF